MKSCVHSAGKRLLNFTHFCKRIRFLIFSFVLAMTFVTVPHAQAENVFKAADKGNYKPLAIWSASVVGGTYLISEMEEGPLAFAGLYGMTSLFLFNEVYRDSEDFTELVVPIGLLTFAAMNVLLLRDDVYDNNDVFLINLGSLSLLGGYLAWDYFSERKLRSYETRVLPLFAPDRIGLALNSSF